MSRSTKSGRCPLAISRPSGPLWATATSWPRSFRSLAIPRAPDRELAPRARPLAPGRDAAAVELDELLDDGQPDAEAPLAPGERPVPLGEQLEHLRELLRRDAVPSVFDRD